MIAFRSILCPFDFSDDSITALRYALAFAQKHDAKLIIQHTVADIAQSMPYMDTSYFPVTEGTLITRAGQELDRVLDSLASATAAKVQKSFDVGEPAEMILQTVREESVDLIIMGSHGRTGNDPYLVGGVTNRVLYRSPVPVLVVNRPAKDPGRAKDTRAIQIKHILCSVDFERGTDTVTDAAVQFGLKYDAEVLFFHVQEPDEEGDWLLEQKIPLEISLQSQSNLRFRFLTQTGNPAHEVIRAAHKYSVDLMVIGHHTKRPVDETVLGSVAIRAVAEAGCPVLVIRS